MRAKHLALTTDRFFTTGAIIVNLDIMLLAYFFLCLVLDQIIDDGNYFLDKSIAACHHAQTFYWFSTVWTLSFHVKAFLNTSLAIQFRAEWTHHWVASVTEAHMAGDQFFELLAIVLCGMINLLVNFSIFYDVVFFFDGNAIHDIYYFNITESSFFHYQIFGSFEGPISIPSCFSHSTNQQPESYFIEQIIKLWYF